MIKIAHASIGIAIGMIISGTTAYLILQRKEEKSFEQLESTNYELGEMEKKLENLKCEFDTASFEVSQLLDAVNIFCDEDTKNNILDLVNTRLNVRMMQQQGFSEEEITDRMIRHQVDDLIQKNEYLSISLRLPEIGKHIVDGLKDGLNSESPEQEMKFEDVIQKNPTPSPYLITKKEYIQGEDEYEHEALTYYALDDTLADDNDDIVDQSVVGINNLKAFEETSEPAIFVRNERLGIEYEIIWCDRETYQNTVLGISQSMRDQRIFRKEGEDE